MVREKGLEPLPRKPGLGPQPSASANSATRAQKGVAAHSEYSLRERTEYLTPPRACQCPYWRMQGVCALRMTPDFP